MHNLQNPSKAQLRIWCRLDKTKVREETDLFLAEGSKIVHALLDSRWKTEALLILKDRKERWAPLFEKFSLPLYELTLKEWAMLTQDVSPEGIMAVGVIPQKLQLSDIICEAGEGPLLLLQEINNPGNLGTLIRTAHWFGFSGVILSRGSVDLLNPKVIRTAMGSLFHIPFLVGASLHEILPEIKKNYIVVGSSVRRGDLPHFCGVKTALLLGSESHGLPEELLKMTDQNWHIPRRGGGESLSLPQAAAILMYECAKTIPERQISEPDLKALQG